ncbi:MAG: hypothetical protein LBF68_04620 [Christensenellaceae bacterium]|jgi:hypothetical protein|nr:hypothetical protein [Christensenellaceae bacterium]
MKKETQQEMMVRLYKEDIHKFVEKLWYIQSRKAKYGDSYDPKYNKYKKGTQHDEKTIRFFNGMFSAVKYNLEKDDPLIDNLLKRNKGRKTIGNIVINEFESIEGPLECDHYKTIELINYMSKSFKATYIYENERFTNKVLNNYNQIDMNSAYSYMMVSTKMPISHYKTFKTIKEYKQHVLRNKLNEENYIIIYTQIEDNKKVVYFEYKEDLEIKEINVYNAKTIGNDFVDKWYNLKQIPKYKKLAKDVLNVAVGAIHRYRQNLISRYIWFLQYRTMEQLKSYIEKKYGTVVRIHTDCIGFISKCEEIKGMLESDDTIRIGDDIGNFKIEHIKKTIYIITAGQYQIRGEPPKLSGLNYGDDGYIHFENGDKVDSKKFPAVKKGDRIVCYNNDEEIIKELKGGFEEFGLKY